MNARIATLLLAFLTMTSAASFAKDDPPMQTLPDDVYDAMPFEVSVEELDTTTLEITEIVTSETMPLPPVVDRPKRNKCAEAIEPFNLKKRHNFVSEWAAFWRLSGYNPTGNIPLNGALMSNLGIRYKLPDKNGAYYQLAYEASYNFWNSSSADIGIVEFSILAFACGSPAFRLEHHPYYGIGLGNAEIKRNQGGTFSENIFTVIGGVEFPGRRVDFDLFAKYIYGPDSQYNLDDLQIGIGVVYTFGRGR
jgi:hypothetical protein